MISPTMWFNGRTMGWVAVAIIMVALAFGNPYSTGWPLKCPLYWMTGYQCPLCGMQRATHELLHLNIIGAWRLNAGYVLCLPYMLLILIGQLSSNVMKWRLVEWCYKDKVIFSVTVLMLVWGIVRNVVTFG